MVFATNVGVDIGIRRLEARPTANLCVDCKTLDEIKERQITGGYTSRLDACAAAAQTSLSVLSMSALAVSGASPPPLRVHYILVLWSVLWLAIWILKSARASG